MGVAYRATDLSLGRPVALRLIAPERAEDERFRERFLREPRLATTRDHPNVIPSTRRAGTRGLPQRSSPVCSARRSPPIFGLRRRWGSEPGVLVEERETREMDEQQERSVRHLLLDEGGNLGRASPVGRRTTRRAWGADRPVRTSPGRSGSRREARPSAGRTVSTKPSPLPSASPRSSTTSAGWRTSIARSASPAPHAPTTRKPSGEVVEEEGSGEVVVLHLPGSGAAPPHRSKG